MALELESRRRSGQLVDGFGRLAHEVQEVFEVCCHWYMDFGTFSFPVEAEAEDDQVVAMHGLGLFVCLLPFVIKDGRVDVDAGSLSLSSSSWQGGCRRGCYQQNSWGIDIWRKDS